MTTRKKRLSIFKKHSWVCSEITSHCLLSRIITKKIENCSHSLCRGCTGDEVSRFLVYISSHGSKHTSEKFFACAISFCCLKWVNNDFTLSQETALAMFCRYGVRSDEQNLIRWCVGNIWIAYRRRVLKRRRIHTKFSNGYPVKCRKIFFHCCNTTKCTRNIGFNLKCKSPLN